MSKNLIFAVMLTLLYPGTAHAHVTLERGEATVAGGYKAVFRVPHGCEGKPTVAVRVRIPEGVISAKPMPKPGWTIEKVKGPYARAYEAYGHPISEGLTEVSWVGGSLADDEYDEFVVSAYLAADLSAGEKLYFPVVQECPEGAAERWIEIPAQGQDAHELEKPAPGLMLLERESDR